MTFTINPFTGQFDEVGVGGGGGGGGGFHWKAVTASDNPVTLFPGFAYVANGAFPVLFTLPPTAAFGNTYRVVGHGNLWKVSQNAFQTMILGIDSTTVGVGGYIQATLVMDSVEITCIEANLDFKATDWSGNPVVV